MPATVPGARGGRRRSSGRGIPRPQVRPVMVAGGGETRHHAPMNTVVGSARNGGGGGRSFGGRGGFKNGGPTWGLWALGLAGGGVAVIVIDTARETIWKGKKAKGFVPAPSVPRHHRGVAAALTAWHPQNSRGESTGR